MNAPMNTVQGALLLMAAAVSAHHAGASCAACRDPFGVRCCEFGRDR